MKSSQSISRRTFIKSSAAAGAAVAIGGLGFFGCNKKSDETSSSSGAPPQAAPAEKSAAESAPAQPAAGQAQGNLPMLSETDPVAQSLGYHHDASKVDTAKWAKRAGPEGAKQTCSNCAQYQSVNAESGRCMIFPAGLVKPGGWCNTWVQKAG